MSYGPSIEYFVEMGYTETDIMMFIANIRTDLARLGITVQDKPPYTNYEHVLDEPALLSYLKDTISYQSNTPLERDKDSIVAIVRLRNGETFNTIEECKAIFVTPNNRLAYATRKFEGFGYQPGNAPHGITDFELTTIVWLKSPTTSPTLPRKRIIADYYAATQPSERLWNKYLAAINGFEKQKSITADEYFLLRHSIQAKSELMESTRGDDNTFTEGTVGEILKLVQDNIRADDVARANKEAHAKQEAILKFEEERDAKLALEAQIAEERNIRNQKIAARARKYSRGTLLLVSISLAVGFGYLTYAISPIGPLAIDAANPLSDWAGVGAFGIFWLLIVLQTINFFFGWMPNLSIARFEPSLTKQIAKLLAVD